jgi:tetratricopeptide (TPR) repeat protein
MRARWILLATLLLALTSTSTAQQWFSFQTVHLISYSSDGKERDAREAAQHSEQLIALFGEIFHRKEINFSPPLRVLAGHAQANGAALNRTALFRASLIRTPGANFVTVDLSQPDSWPQAAKFIASLTLENNYPRAQPWFDCGIASYLAGVQFNGDQMQLGGAPPGMPGSGEWTGEWIPMAKLFAVSELSQLPTAQRTTFAAESWALVRWLIDNGKLAEAGAYLNAVQAHGAGQEQAVAEAFAMSSSELDRRVRESLEKISVKSAPAPHIEGNLLKGEKVSAADAHVIETKLLLSLPEPERALNELVAFMRVNQENAAVHRALAWAFLLHHDMENAVEHIRRALALDDSDPAMHYLYARWVNQGEEDKIRVESAETRMSTELKAALKIDPNYAAALELLGLAELSDGNTKAALANLQRASALSPRSSRYYLNLARAYQAAGNLDAARNLMLYARAGGDAAISNEVGELLDQLDKVKKRQQQWADSGLLPDPNVKPNKYDNLQEAIAEDEKAEAKSKSPEARQDMRKVEYLKGRIVGVECGAQPGAILNVSSAGHTWRMHVADRKTIVLIGVDHFDCGWHDAAVSINFKRTGDFQGEMVSLEANR